MFSSLSAQVMNALAIASRLTSLDDESGEGEEEEVVGEEQEYGEAKTLYMMGKVVAMAVLVRKRRRRDQRAKVVRRRDLTIHSTILNA